MDQGKFSFKPSEYPIERDPLLFNENGVLFIGDAVFEDIHG